MHFIICVPQAPFPLISSFFTHPILQRNHNRKPQKQSANLFNLWSNQGRNSHSQFSGLQQGKNGKTQNDCTNQFDSHRSPTLKSKFEQSQNTQTIHSYLLQPILIIISIYYFKFGEPLVKRQNFFLPGPI